MSYLYMKLIFSINIKSGKHGNIEGVEQKKGYLLIE